MVSDLSRRDSLFGGSTPGAFWAAPTIASAGSRPEATNGWPKTGGLRPK